MDEVTHSPKCPGCGVSPFRFNYNAQVVPNGAVISMVWCSDCGHIFSMNQVGQQRPLIAPADKRIIENVFKRDN